MSEIRDNEDHTHGVFGGIGLAIVVAIALSFGSYAANRQVHETGYENLVERLDVIELLLDCPEGGVVYVDGGGEEVCLEPPKAGGQE